MSETAILSQHTVETTTSGAILIIDDEAAIGESLETLLEFEGYSVESAETGEQGLTKIGERPFDLVLLDFALPDRNGLEVLADIRDRDPQLAVIVITAYGTVDNAVRVIQSGATNFIQKPWDNEKLLSDVRAVVARRRAEQQNEQLKRAVASKKGLFEVADGGTIFLDEIGTMGLETQSKILRVLQDKKFMHLGGVHEIQVDVRVIAATNIDLKTLVREGRFREDLFYRLNVITVDLPPLRSRAGDIPLLVTHFLSKFSAENGKPPRQISSEALRPIMDYGWPGNVRELENVIERAVVLSNSPFIGIDLLPDNIVGRGSRGKIFEHRPDATLFEIVEDCERRIIVDMLEKCGWNQTEAAERFRVPLSTLNQKIKRLNLEIRKKSRETDD